MLNRANNVENIKDLQSEEIKAASISLQKIRQETSSFMLRHSFLSNLSERLDVGKNLRSRDIDWYKMFGQAIGSYANIRLLIKDLRFEDEVNFVVVLEHKQPLNIDESYGDSALFTGSGIIVPHHRENIYFSVRGPTDQTYYIAENASVFEIRINELKVKDQENLDKKITESFEKMKSAFEYMFSKGIHRMNAQTSLSWEGNKGLLYKKMVDLAEWYNADFVYDANCFPQSTRQSYKI